MHVIKHLKYVIKNTNFYFLIFIINKLMNESGSVNIQLESSDYNSKLPKVHIFSYLKWRS